VAVQERQGASGLWSKFLSPGETLLQVVILVVDTGSTDANVAPAMTCVAHTGNVELWHADFGTTCTMACQASNTEFQWRLPAEMLHRDH